MNENLIFKTGPRKKFPIMLTLGFIACLILAILANIFLTRSNDGRWLSPAATGSTGGGALAEVIRSRGVDLRHIETKESFSQITELIEENLAHGTDLENQTQDTDSGQSQNTGSAQSQDVDSEQARKETATILVVNPDSLSSDSVSELLQTGANIVLVTENYFWNIDEWGFSFEELLEDAHNPESVKIDAQCSDSRAGAAKAIQPVDKFFNFQSENIAVACFLTESNTPGDKAAALLTSSKYPQVTVLSTGKIWENQNLQKAGNAALGLNLLGQSKYLFWVENYSEDSQYAPLKEFTIPWLNVLLASGLCCAFWLLLYQVRRFGRLVPEPMPVVVPAGEADFGRAQLYRASRDFAHLAKIQRANFISLYAAKLGITPQNSPEEIAKLLAEQSGSPVTWILDLLFTSEIRTETELRKLSSELEKLDQRLRQ